ncbi:MAG: TonB-dependent receptor domain-containing protein [Panacagrimonas sp.]
MNKLTLAACLGLACVASAPAHSQSAPEPAAPVAEVQFEAASVDTIPLPEPAPPDVPEAPAERAASRLTEEIVVTAQKREESLQDVPISVQAFSGEMLDARGVDSTEDLPSVTPGLQLSGVAGYTLIYLRGVGTDAFAPSSDPSVATYIDGVYIPSGHGIFQGFGAVQRVEVLKGPQGSLFGRNSTGGAISITTKDPDLEEMEGQFVVEGGNFKSRKAKGYLSVPVTDWLAISLAGLYDKQDSVYTHVNREIPEDHLYAGRIKVRLQFTENLGATLTHFRADQRNLSTVIAKNTQTSTPFFFLPEAEDNYVAEIDYPTQLQGEQEVTYGVVDWNLPWFDVKLIGSDTYVLTDLASTDFDGTSVPIVAFDSTNQYSDYQTGELQLISNDESWGADRFQWIAGLYYLRSQVGYDPAHLFVGPNLVEGLIENTLGLPFPDALSGLLERLDLDGTPLGDDGLSIQFRGLLGTRSYSAFTQGTWFVSDQWHLTLGARYQYERRFLVKSETGVQTADRETTLEIFQFPLFKSSVKNLSPKAVLNWFPVDDTMIYLSASRGFKSATYNVVNVYEPSDYVKPEKVTSYELGSKSEFLGGALRFNSAIFQNDIDDLQAGFVSLLAGGAVTLENAGAARIRGLEFDTLVLPMPQSNPGLVLTAGAAYLRARYTDYEMGSGFGPVTGIFRNDLDHSGNTIVRSPKYTVSLAAVQTIAVGQNGEAEIGVDWYYNDGYFFTAQNSVQQGSYDLLGARLSYLVIPWDLRLTAFGSNLLDERYHIGKFELDFGVNTTLADPRTYGLRMEWNF